MESVIERPGKRRRRPKVSCSLCRLRKIKCDRERPCSNCLRSRTGECIYDDLEPSSLSSGQQPTPPAESLTSATGASRTPSRPSSLAAESGRDDETTRLRSKIHQLEEQLARTTRPAHGAYTNIEATSSHISGTFHLHYKRDPEHPEPIACGFSLKTRLLGQSHWAVSIAYSARDLFKSLELCIHEFSDACIGIEKCKALARRIKAQRTPSWPPLPSVLPSRLICDRLVERFLRRTESLYRILHIPTFYKKYEKLWSSKTEQDLDFAIQLKLVLAIGAVTYDDQFSLRTSATQWIYEAQIWMSGPKYKARLNIEAIQTSLLLLVAQEQVRVGGDVAWVSAGALLRKAIYMGLHRDPSHLPQRTVYAAEMYRRLWNTILEVNLQSSLSYGGAPLISLSDYDTVPPGNFDDEQLQDKEPTPKSDHEMTQSSFAIALRRTLPQRLAVVKFLNDLASPGTYKQTLQIDTELRAAYRELCQTLRTLINSTASLSSFQHQTEMVDFLMQRYFSALHAPYFGPSLHGTTYAFSRKLIVDSSLKIWRAACLPTPGLSDSSARSGIPQAISNDGGLPRLISCSSGFYPTAVSQAVIILLMELRAQLQEDTSLNPVPVRPDLLSVLDDAKAWCLRVIEAGETSVKGYLLISLVVAQVKGMMDGLRDGDERMRDVLVKAVEEVAEVCLPILERMAKTPVENHGPGADTDGDISVGIMGNWDPLTLDTCDLFNLDGTDPMSFMFDDDFNLGGDDVGLGADFDL
ncbi:hypothetical protein BDW74DRAFT_189360 [Aspergillus multicolor]|uniref:uncharacterized protein n=1 Tax=Aspergillus multicolor TaxID=41759 RepID=UPI003CCD1E66